jgi:phosphatidylserine/phosphatidylglycerophosphate/cardiolipin synthase-like enzyme
MTISATFLEEAGQRPEEIADLLAGFLDAAETSIHMAIYDFRLRDALAAPVAETLRRKAEAGVDVRIAFDSGKKSVPFHRVGADPAPIGTRLFVEGLGKGIGSRAITGGDPQMPMLMHHKYVVRDGRTSLGALWTGSTNFTGDSWTLQENNILRLDSPELCSYYENDFDELWASGDIATTGLHDHGIVPIGQRSVSVSFAPGDGRSIDHDIAAHISGARRRIKVASMLITSGSILGALRDALAHGHVAEFGGIYDRTQMDEVLEQWQGSPAEWKIDAFEKLSGALVGKRSNPFQSGNPHNFMHNKVVVVDDTVITGSYNLSNSAIQNAENVLMIRDPDLAHRYCVYIDRLAERYGDDKTGRVTPSART